jgi:exonuclease SbcC
MQPLWLRLENFGPYRNTTIDFQQLASDTVFLISGKTGSGKTTIFDAMCFALFNRTSGNERQGQQMRSKFAEPTALTQVTFCFQAGVKVYEIQRLPEQLVAKKRGTGFRKQPAKVTLKIFQDQTQIAEHTKAGTVKTALEEVLQLDADQFAQIILLPQGEFRRFLIANSDEKEQVLRRLFGTERYAKWTQQMQQVFNQQQNQAKEKLAQLTQLVQQIHWTGAAPDVTDPTSLAPLLKQEIKQQQQALVQAKTAVDQQQQVVQQAQTKLNQGEQVVKWQVALAEKQQALATLAAQQDQLATWQAQIKRLTQLQHYQTTFESWQQQQQQLTQQNEALQHTAQAIKQQQAQQTQLQNQVATLAQQAPAMERQRQQLHVWQALQPAVEQLTQTTADLTNAQQVLTKRQMSLKQVETQQTTLQTKLVQCQQQVAQLSAQLQQQTALTQQQQQLTAWQTQVQALQTTAAAVAKQATAVVTAAQQQQAALQACQAQTETTQQLKSQWAAEQISRLQQLLQPGQPCPVCGSTTHTIQPQTVKPATVTEAQVTASEADLAVAQQKTTQRTTELENQQRQLTQQRQTQTSAEQALIAELQQASIIVTDAAVTLETVQTTLKTQQENLQTQLTEVEQAYQTSQQAQTQVTALQAQQQAQTTKTTALQQDIQAQQLTITRLQTQQQDLQQQMPAQYQSATAFKQNLAQLTADLDTFDQQQQRVQQAQQQGAQQLAGLQAQQTTQQQQLKQQQTTLTQQSAALQSGLQTIWPDITPPFTDYAAALAEVAQLPTIQAKVADYQTQQLTLTTEMQQLQQELGQQQRPDLADLKAALATSQTALDELTADYYQQQQDLTANQQYQQQLTKGLKAQAETLKTLSEQARLVNVVTGNNVKKLSLERYVLQQYLLQVLQVANQRLLPLTNGRYQLQLSDATGSYRNQTGLELNIFDDSVGAVRSVQTLSGGESFIASLALALAFGEVIQAQNGQTRIETLFIDEGFGSLDAESLDVALNALESLHATHQMIGIISHVAALRDRIPNQLQVVMDGGGQSHVRYQLPGMK